MATRLFLHSDVQQKVRARLGLDQQLWYFASNLTALDAHFFSAAELLLQQEGQLVQHVAQLLGAGGWRYQPRALQKPGAASLEGVVAWSPYVPQQAPAAVLSGDGSASRGPAKLKAGAAVLSESAPHAADGVQQKEPGTAAATSEPTVGSGYKQPSMDVLISSCGWVGLRPT
jgi:hypothetical protein